jgi:hypothetical protein
VWGAAPVLRRRRQATIRFVALYWGESRLRRRSGLAANSSRAHLGVRFDLRQELGPHSLLHSALALEKLGNVEDCGAGRASRRLLRRQPSLNKPTPGIDVNSSALYEVIAGIALIITGLFLGYDELWGRLMILLGVLVIFFWVARMGWML